MPLAQGKLKKLSDLLFRLTARGAYPIIRRWNLFSGRRNPGAAVAVWYGGELLVVRHSYVSGASLPGGGIQGGESAAQAAVRELNEEVGISADPAELQAIFAIDRPKTQLTLFEFRPSTRPRVTIDNREIVEAKFAAPGSVADPSEILRSYLKVVEKRRNAPPERL